MSLLTRFCLFDLVELLLARQFSSQLELRSLVRRFGLLIDCLLKNEPKPYKLISQYSVPIAALLFY